MRCEPSSKRSLLLLAGVLVLAVGCARHPQGPIATGGERGDHPEASPAPVEPLPFDRVGKQDGISPSESLLPAAHRVPAGTSITIRLQSAVSSATARPGDTFDAILDEPVTVGGDTVAPLGAPVTGRVLAAKASGRLQDPGYLRLTLASVTVNGKAVSVQSSSISVRGKSHEKRNWESIGGGAAAGALIGGLAGGGKGAVIGGAVGAGGGTGFAYATGKKDVGFGAERRLTFRLTAALDVKR